MKLKWQGKGKIPKSIKVSRAFSDRVKSAVEGFTPVDTGRMKASYIVTTTGNKITVNNTAKSPKKGFPYPKVIEFGSVKLVARMPVRKGIQSVINRIPANMHVVVGDLASNAPISKSILDKYY